MGAHPALVNWPLVVVPYDFGLGTRSRRRPRIGPRVAASGDAATAREHHGTGPVRAVT